ncbi:hypothetical protein JQC67_10685 [Aurantibacter crassamenti]|uniref:hypothetical protein n=1 Tax=Aurantibacter crassamenti TaxID=1837375 RepID=UPI00193ABD95|nr:hypothetical protein [Aurantibacter crassamenti]MBM1106605.1 hypothetical protein [Aurantibacter crassamenti]
MNSNPPIKPPYNVLFKGFEVVEKEKFWINAEYSLTAELDNIAYSFGDQVTAGYEIIDLRLGVIPMKNLTLSVAALNVFDTT